MSADELGAEFGRPAGGWRLKLYRVVFESDTPAGRAFDLALITLILASVAVVLLGSIAPFDQLPRGWLLSLEWFFTLAFTAEYAARLLCVERPLRYARSFYGVIDLLAALPTYLALLLPGVESLLVVRVLRLLRVFRIFKLAAYVTEYSLLVQALLASRRKILVFMSFVLLVMVVMGTLMYVVEGPEHGFHNIPTGIYWAITTMTTVGFGDIAPKTGLGRFIASVMMLLGWGTLAVPTGIVGAEFNAQRLALAQAGARSCERCLATGHGNTARFCSDCGAALPPVAHPAAAGAASRN